MPLPNGLLGATKLDGLVPPDELSDTATPTAAPAAPATSATTPTIATSAVVRPRDGEAACGAAGGAAASAVGQGGGAVGHGGGTCGWGSVGSESVICLSP